MCSTGLPALHSMCPERFNMWRVISELRACALERTCLYPDSGVLRVRVDRYRRSAPLYMDGVLAAARARPKFGVRRKAFYQRHTDSRFGRNLQHDADPEYLRNPSPPQTPYLPHQN